MEKYPQTQSSEVTCVTGEASAITERLEELSGYIDPSFASSDMIFGIIYSKDENPTAENGNQIIAEEIDDRGSFTVTVKSLSSNTDYYYTSLKISV